MTSGAEGSVVPSVAASSTGRSPVWISTRVTCDIEMLPTHWMASAVNLEGRHAMRIALAALSDTLS